MKLNAYPVYVDSHVDWLGETPEHWTVSKLKFLISDLESGVSVNAADYPKSENAMGVLKTSCVYTREFRASENKTVFDEEIPRLKCPVRRDSIIVSRMNTRDLVGAAAYVSEDHENLYLPDRLWQTVIPSKLRCSTKFIHYFMFLQGFRDQISNYAEGASSSMQNIAKEDFLSINVLIPTFPEQQEIADFLDYETAKIDRLIEKQQQLIELLKEKRQAVISHAVTKGLNPNAPLKPSGVEWLGDVPEHWEVKRLKQAIESGSSISYGIVQPGDPIDIGIPFVQTTNMSKGTLGLEDLQNTTAEIANRYPRSTLKGGEVILGIRATIGAAFVVPDHLCGANLSRGVARIAPDQSLNPAFLATFLGSDHVKRYWELSKQGSTFSEVSIETVREISIPVPPIAEQVQISRSIKARTRILDNLIEMAESKTTLLQERRTALISAAVTGKIDVRDWQSPKAKENLKADREAVAG